MEDISLPFLAILTSCRAISFRNARFRKSTSLLSAATSSSSLAILS